MTAPTMTTSPAVGAAATTARKSKAARVVLAGGLAAMALLLALGSMLESNATFSDDYVGRQLREQRIRFPEYDALKPEEQAEPCLAKYAGQELVTGKQAECYANKFIGRHLKLVAGGKTFSEMRVVQDGLRAKIAEAQSAGDAAAAGEYQRQLGEATGKRQALLEGESMRGLLLTSYGFSTLGTKAGEAATAAQYGSVGVLAVAVATAVILRRRAAKSVGSRAS